jgi:hypothetical protein
MSTQDDHDHDHEHRVASWRDQLERQQAQREADMAAATASVHANVVHTEADIAARELRLAWLDKRIAEMGGGEKVTQPTDVEPVDLERGELT